MDKRFVPFWSRPAAPVALGAAACAACCAIPLTGILVGAGAASTAAAFFEPLAGVLLAAAAGLAVLLVVRRRRARAASCQVGCSLGDREWPERQRALRRLFAAATDRELGPSRASWAFAWSPAIEAQVREITAKERTCCSFFTFDIERRGAKLRWTATAPPERQGALQRFAEASKPA